MTTTQPETLSTPYKSSALKREETHSAAMDIVNKERASREKKTAILRDLRLAREAEQAEAPPAIILGSPRQKRS